MINEHDHNPIQVPRHNAVHDARAPCQDMQEPMDTVCGCACANEKAQGVAVALPPSRKNAQTWYIPGMDCLVEETEIRNALEDIQDIHSLSFQFASQSLTIIAPENVRQKAFQAIREAGFNPRTVKTEERGHAHDHDHPHSANSSYWKLGIAFCIALGVEILDLMMPDVMPFEMLELSLAIGAIALAGIDVYLNGIRALFRSRLNINALMAVAVTGACILGQWGEAAMVMVLYVIAEHIEARSIDRARQAIQKLLALVPETAEQLLPDGSWQNVPAKEVRPGTMIRVKPGERIPLDGTVRQGYSAVNQIAITGESIPVEKVMGEAVYAGSISESGVLEIEVTALAEDTMLARIISAVEEAQANRAPIQRFVDRFAAIYTPVIFLIAVAVAVLMPFLAGWTWHDAVYRALVLLVIACPCALVIATPLTIVCALSAAAGAGILIKGGAALETARNLRVVAFDKTGTITEGKPRLIAVEKISPDVTRAEILRLAATLTSHSNHPVSRAILADLLNDTTPDRAEEFTEVPGKGSQARINGKKYTLGSIRWITEQGLMTPAIAAILEPHEKTGYTVTLLASGTAVLGVFSVADTIRVNSWEAIYELGCRNITPVMLTGDNTLTAQAIAEQAGITDIHSNLLPEEKLTITRALHEQHGTVAMVGDGINDAPALAAADIGIAMGAAGSDIAMETADVVIMNDDLRRVVDLVRLSRRTFHLLRQNIAIALGIKFIFFGLALTGYASMWMAVFADVGATLIVVFNGLRLLQWKTRFPAG